MFSRRNIKALAIFFAIILLITGCEDGKDKLAAINGVSNSQGQKADKDKKPITLAERVQELELNIPLDYINNLHIADYLLRIGLWPAHFNLMAVA